jgi:hypothetical protein
METIETSLTCSCLLRRVLTLVPLETLALGSNQFSGTLAGDLFQRLDKLGMTNWNPESWRLYAHRNSQSTTHTP